MLKSAYVAAITAALLAGGVALGYGLHKDVNLSLDGRAVPGGAFALTVADVLGARGIRLAEGDQVYPDLRAAAADGQQIEVRFNKPVTLIVDGTARTFTTTAKTVADLLAEQELSVADSGWVSLPASAQLPRAGLKLAVSTQKPVRLKMGEKVVKLTTAASTVAHLLAERGLNLAPEDRVRPSLDSYLTADLTVVLDRVTVRTATRTEAVEFKTVQKKNPSLWKGESRVQVAGKKGQARSTYRITEVNGKTETRVLLSQTMLREPISQVVEIGTKTTANGVGLNLARAAMWDRIAQCESSGRWNINTGNGYYGGLQFNLVAWRTNGGRDFAAYPHQATRAEQITVANRYYAKAGLRPWACKP